MNDEITHLSEPNKILTQAEELASADSICDRFFQRVDWLSFWLTTVLVLAGYLFTLAPDVTLEKSGLYSTGAMYAGVAHPSGYPVWTIYAWVFTKLPPFSNIAWRVGVSTAVAGAVTCGIIALMVSRGGMLIIEGISGFKRIELREEIQLRIVCGCIAGLALGFDGAFWDVAVIVDVWPFTVLLLTLTICLLMRWMYSPAQRRYLYAACFVYGLTLTNSQALLTVAFGLQIFIMFGDWELGREIFFVNCMLLLALIVSEWWGYMYFMDTVTVNLRAYYVSIGIGSGVLCLGLIIWTRKFLTRWKAALICMLMIFLALLMYFYMPIASMTNPPVNWGYARTGEGFFHALTRGQYERPFPTDSLGRYMEQIRMYGEIAASEFGLVYLFLALIPFCLLHKMRVSERKWMLSLLAVYLCLAFLMLALLNPFTDKGGREMVKTFLTASHVVLAIWTGCGLILLGSWITKPAIKPSAPALSSPL
ncbi:MAG: hypothetical protein JWQ71_574 [Pedosphaera sp.]|nr:hypothetical protein [Pedosphaera sp.]